MGMNGMHNVEKNTSADVKAYSRLDFF